MNENSAVRNAGERITSLETRYETIVERLNHLDDCVDGVKEQASASAKVWDRRWYIGMGIVIGVLAVSGLSLKTLLDILAKLH